MKSLTLKATALFFLASTAVAGAATFDGLLCEGESATIAAKAITGAPALTAEADTAEVESLIAGLIADGKCSTLADIDESALTNATFTTATGREKVGTAPVNGKTFVFVDIGI